MSSAVDAAMPQSPASVGVPALDIASVYEANVDYVVRCVRALGLRDQRADDAVQDVFLIVHGKLGGFEARGPNSLRNWLYAIAVRVVRRYRASERETPMSPELENALDGRLAAWPSAQHGNDAVDQVGRGQAARLVEEILDRLDDAKREVFVLSELEQLSGPEIASITGTKVNTVYARLRLARQEFKLHLQRRQSTRRGRDA